MKEAEFTKIKKSFKVCLILTLQDKILAWIWIKHVATEGTEVIKKVQRNTKHTWRQCMPNSVDLNAMRDALKLDESADANTVVAEYNEQH